jgi:hypothetical protein
LISLSRGFFEFQFANPEDKMKPGQLVPIICDQGCSTSQSGNLISKKRVFGHYDRVLINIDLPKRIFDEVMVERESFAFYVYILYERLLEFRSNCFTTEHSVSLCNMLHVKNKENRVKLDKPKLKGDSSS